MATIPDRLGFDAGLPANIDAERTILGAILLANEAYYEAVGDGITADDFALDSHRRIFLRMSQLTDVGHPVDIVTLAEELARNKEVASVGGVAYLASLTEGLPRRPVINAYIRIVKDKAVARRLMGISTDAIARAADQSETGAVVVADTIGLLEDSLAQVLRRKARSIADILADDAPRFDAETHAPAVGTLGASLFTPELSRLTCGIQQAELCLLCARPGQGKTEAAVQVIVDNARRGLRVHMHSLEMREHQIARRMMRYIARVPVQHMRDLRCLRPDEKESLNRARQELADLPIVIDDTHELTCSEYRSRCVLAAKRWRADLIVTDYGQLLKVPKAKNIIEAAPTQAETLRHIARDYCRTLALAQLRRAPPNDLNRYPDMEDILGSSAYEQAAQIILMMHRAREKKRYTGEDHCFLVKMRELQTIQPLGIGAEPWGGFKDRYAPQD